MSRPSRAQGPWWILCFFLALGSLRAWPNQPPPEPPNFVVILCDNLGYGDIGPFGSRLHDTPNLDRMAAEGRLFEHFYAAAGVCTPSRAALLTGRYPCRVGLAETERDGLVLRPLSPHGLAAETVSLADVLKAAGYRTALFGKWHLGDQPRYLPTRHGFDEYLGIPYSDDMTQDTGRRLGERYDGYRWPPLPLIRNETIIQAPVDLASLTERLTEETLAFIRRHRQQRFFVVLSHVLPGSRQQPEVGARFRGRSRNGLWGDAVAEIDWSTGKILDLLRELGLARRTLVLFTSDNGAPTTGRPGDYSRGSNGPLEGRGYTTAEGGQRVPLIAWWPGTVPAGTKCTSLCTMMDLLPTFARLASAPLPSDLPLDGQDITGLLTGDGQPTERRVFYYFHGRQLQAIRYGRYKLYLPLARWTRHPQFRRGQTARPLLYDVVSDPGCRHDISRSRPELVKQLLALSQKAPCQRGSADTPPP